MQLRTWMGVLIAVLILAGCATVPRPGDGEQTLRLSILSANGGPADQVEGVLRTWGLRDDGRLTSDNKARRVGPSESAGALDIPVKKVSKVNPEDPESFSTGDAQYELYLYNQREAARLVWEPHQTVATKITLSPTVRVELRLEGDTVRGRPVLTLEKYPFSALFKKVAGGRYHDLERVAPNRWAANVLEGESYLIGWPAGEDVMFGYLSEPFTAKEGQVVSFSPGMPSSVEYEISSPPKDVACFPAQVWIRKVYPDGSGLYFRPWVVLKKPGVVKIGHLAGGRYQVGATGDPSFTKPSLYDTQDIVVESGKEIHVEAKFPRIDRTVEEGDFTIRGVVVNSDGTLVEGREVFIIPQDSDQMWRLYYPVQTTNSHGEFEFIGVDPRYSYSVQTDRANGKFYQSFIAKGAVPREGAVQVVLSDRSRRLDLSPGAQIADLAVTKPDGSTFRLSSLRGKIVVMDIWATWCAPCIAELPRIAALARANQSDDLIFIALSVDSVKDDWTRYLAKHPDVGGPIHGWMDREANPIPFAGAIPFKIIIDRDGIIRAAGNEVQIPEALRVLGVSVESPSQ